MNLILDVDGPIIHTRFEPVDEEEFRNWKALRGKETEQDEEGAWVAFFVLPKSAAAPFVDELWMALEAILGDVFGVYTIMQKRYCYVVASAEIDSLDFGNNGSYEQAWAVCRRVSRAHNRNGCAMFSPRRFLKYDRSMAEFMLAKFLDFVPVKEGKVHREGVRTST